MNSIIHQWQPGNWNLAKCHPLFSLSAKSNSEKLSIALSYSRLKDLEPDIDMTLLADWQITPFAATPFIQWWSEWQEHIFCKSANLYCMALDNNYQSGENEVEVKLPPKTS